MAITALYVELTGALSDVRHLTTVSSSTPINRATFSADI
jgi:hypothetical protein